MRKKLDLNLRSMDKFTMLVHGSYSTGKTHLIGDMLRHESKVGPTLFINIKGEDGSLSIADMELGETGETVENLKDWKELITEYKGKNLRGLGLDSMKALCRIVMEGKISVDRPPEKTEYGLIHWFMESLTKELRTLAPVVLCVCPSDKSINQIDGRTYITPDLPGREAAGSAGWFDAVGYLRAETISAIRVDRTITFAPNPGIVTRVRLPRPITQDILIPNGGGGWQTIMDIFQKKLNEASEAKH